MKNRLILSFASAFTIIVICFISNFSFAQSGTITVIFGNEEKFTVSRWSFVYHLVRSNEVVSRGSTTEPLQKKSQNLYLIERYDQEEGKTDFGKGKEIKINSDQLSSIEYGWNWKYGTLEKVIITLSDGKKLTRLRLGPFATSFLGDDKFLYCKTLYLEGEYQIGQGLKYLNYNLNKWIKGKVSKEEIIKKIIF